MCTIPHTCAQYYIHVHNYTTNMLNLHHNNDTLYCSIKIVFLRELVFTPILFQIYIKGLSSYFIVFLVVFSFFEKTTYCCRARRLSVCPSVRLSSVEIISFRGNSLSNRPINLNIGLNVREGVVHVRKV